MYFVIGLVYMSILSTYVLLDIFIKDTTNHMFNYKKKLHKLNIFRLLHNFNFHGLYF